MTYPNKAYRTLIGVCIIHLISGAQFLYGDLSVYIASYYYDIDNEITLDFTYYVMLGLAFSGIAANFTAVRLSNHFGHRPVLAAALASSVLTYFLSAYIKNFYLFCVVFGFLFGFAGQLLFLGGLAIVWQWFIQVKSLITGIVLSCYAGSIMVFAWLAGKLTNPHNEPARIKVIDGQQVYYLFEANIAYNLPQTLRILSGVFLVLGVVGFALISIHDEIIEEKPVANGESPRRAIKAQQGTALLPFYKSRAFWTLYAVQYLAAIPVFFSSLQYKSYGLIVINDDEFMSLVGSLSGFANMTARMFWGSTFKTLTFPVCLAIVLILIAIGTFALLFVKTHVLYAATFVILQFAAGGLFTIFAPELMVRWGAKQGPLVFATFITGNNLALITNVFIGKFGIGLIGYASCFKALFLSAIAAIGLCYIVVKVIDDHENRVRISFGPPTEQSERLSHSPDDDQEGEQSSAPNPNVPFVLPDRRDSSEKRQKLLDVKP